MTDRIKYRLLLGMAGLQFLLQLLPLLIPTGFGIFRDELYFWVCTHHPAAGYVDHPPLCVLILKLLTRVFGDGLFAFRIWPAICSAALVYLTGRIVGELKGGRFAMLAAMIAVAFSPVLSVLGSFYSMNCLEPLLFAGLFWLLIRYFREPSRTIALLIGMCIGLGMINKHTFAVYVFLLFVSLLLSPYRRSFWNVNSIYIILSAGLIAIPNLVWVLNHLDSVLEFYTNASLNKNIDTPPLQILSDQLLSQHPLYSLVWIAGLFYFFRSAEWRWITGMYVLLLLTMLVSASSRPDRIAAVYPILFAGGACWWEQIFRKRIARVLFITIQLVAGLFLYPTYTPVLNKNQTADLFETLGIKIMAEKGKSQLRIPQFLEDRIGWTDLADSVASVHQRLSREYGEIIPVFAANYGYASTLMYPKPHLDAPVLSPHNNYYFWSKQFDLSQYRHLLLVGVEETYVQDNTSDYQVITVIRSGNAILDNTPLILAPLTPELAREIQAIKIFQ